MLEFLTADHQIVGKLFGGFNCTVSNTILAPIAQANMWKGTLEEKSTFFSFLHCDKMFILIEIGV